MVQNRIEFNSAQVEIKKVCEEVKELLLRKNKSYGNNSLNPVSIFSKLPANEQINSRIDDKLSRISRGEEFENEDTELDLIGYLILKRVYKNLTRKSIRGKNAKRSK